MKFFQISPQCAGTTGDETICPDWSVRPVAFQKLQFELELWPEDDLIEASFSAYAGTRRLAEAIKAAELTGIEFDLLDMIKYDQFWLWEEEHPGETIPEYLWFKFTGEPGSDDFGQIPLPIAMELTISDRALALLKQFNLANCDVKEFDPSLVVVKELDRSN